ncbi:MAG: sugar phosphate nucleotidyltransferase [Nanoarchaeota archaeon]|nr:sugar phosphate nucleotidyltransferase [Nanoarchaeota archaeon]
MKKPKIAISLDQSLLDQIDSKVDGSIIRSRSQAIEYFLRKGLKESSIDTAVLLIKGDHQESSLKTLKGKSLLSNQIDFFALNGIKTLYIITQHTPHINMLLEQIDNTPITVKIVEKNVKGNADALIALKDKLKQNFVVMSGDTYNNFDLLRMIKKHLELDKLSSMGLMSIDQPSKYGNAILDGDLIIDFQEKPKLVASNVVNAGIYIFKPEIFELFENIHSLEKDLFPKLARIKQLSGFFTHGEYKHFG